MPAPSVKQRADERVRLAVRAHLGVVWRVLRRAGLRPADADDAAQDVFCIFSQRLDDVPEPAVRSFLIGSAIRVASDRRRNRWNRVNAELDEETPGDQLDPEKAAARQESLILLDRALETLDDDARDVFVTVELEQLTRDEAAVALGIPPGTVASRLRKAREQFHAAARRLHLQSTRSTS